jgi:DNA-binding IclR family transcriptional regulator
MPGLSLTISQAARFWGLNATALEVLLSTLVDTGFLVCDGKGLYRRRV